LGAGAQQAAPAQNQRVIGNLHDLYALSTVEAGRGYPIQLDVTVVYSDPQWGLLFVQDGAISTFLNAPENKQPYPLGAHLKVFARTGASPNGTAMVHPRIFLVGIGKPPEPQKTTLAQIDAGSVGGQWVQAVGVLHPCNEPRPRPCFRLFDGDKVVWMTVRDGQYSEMAGLIGALVNVRGVVTDYTDSSGKIVGRHLFVYSRQQIAVLEPPQPSYSAPLPISQLVPAMADERYVRPVHIQGMVNWSSPDLLSVQDTTGTVFVDRHDKAITQTGEQVDVLGFPHRGEMGLELADSSFVVHAGHYSTLTLTPIATTIDEVLKYSFNGKRIRVRAKFISQEQTANSTIYHFEEDGTPFTAILMHGPEAFTGAQLPRNAPVDLTGVAVLQGGAQKGSRSLIVLPESPADIVVRTGLEWLTLRTALAILGVMLLLVLAPFVWIGQLRRTVHRQTKSLRKQMEHELELERRFRRFFERNLAAVFIWHSNGIVVSCNQAFVSMLGLQNQEEVIGRSLWDFASDSEQQTLLGQLAENEVLSNYQSQLRRSDGSPLHLLMNITAVSSPESLVYETTAIDITELQQARTAAVRESLRDALTGLPNRRCVMENLNREIENARQDGYSMAILYLDLDGFKLANDGFGHGFGDLLLIEIAEGMLACVPAGNLLARVGGDEFLLVMPRISSPEEAEEQGRRFLDAVSRPFCINDHTISLGVSIGIGIFPHDAETVDDLLKSADSAMYAAKRAGKNNLMFFSPAIGSDAHERLLLEKQLHSAILRNEISVHYQPEFDLANLRLTRFEALARWNHATMGSIPPARFIPIAEENGFINRLGAFVMQEACLEALRWQALTPYPIQVAVNVSSMQIHNRNFVQEVKEILALTGLEPSLLQIEITESAMLEKDAVVSETLHQLRALGISLAIDDFGTGYSNLSYLPSRVFDVLKIDRSFLKERNPRPETKTMIHTIAYLAKQIGMKVIAEGVETAEQLAVIQECGADEAQGFLLGRPVPDPVEACLLPYAKGSEAFPQNQSALAAIATGQQELTCCDENR
jgi:diguanylate cyclase (GGDEF)-like protein/PAS domain S-box-containing protein